MSHLYTTTQPFGIPSILASFAPQFKSLKHTQRNVQGVFGVANTESEWDNVKKIREHPQPTAVAANKHQQHKHQSHSFLEDLLHEHQLTVNGIGRRMVKGALIGGLAYYYYEKGYKPGDRVAVNVRKVLFNGNQYLPRSVYKAAILGSLLGLGWYYLHDCIICPHGKSTLNRQILAYGTMGSIVTLALYHPAAIGYGFLNGALLGLITNAISQPVYPSNFKLYLKDFDEEKRAKKLREDAQRMLSNHIPIREMDIKMYDMI